MATTTRSQRLRPPLFYSLGLTALMLLVAGCWPADGPGERASPEPRASSPGAIAEEARAELAPPPEQGEAPLALPSAESDQPDSQIDAQPQQPAPPPPLEPDAPEGEPAAQPADPLKGPFRGPRLGENPLRNGGAVSAGHALAGATGRPVGKPASGKGKHPDVPFDPVKENGPIFVGWPKPKAALVITGRQEGYLEPCGCAGLERMKGGLSRRLSMIEHLRYERGWAVAAVDVGGLVDGFGPQAELKFQTTVNAIQAMQYDAIALGKSDLQFSVGDLLFAGTGDESPFISANAALFGFEYEPPLTERKRIIETGGMRLGVTSVLGKKWQSEVNNSDIKLADPQEKLAELVPALRKECDLLILLAHATKEEAMDLARQFSQFDIVVTAGGPAEPPVRPQYVDGSKTMLIEVGEKAMNAVVLGFFDLPSEGHGKHVPQNGPARPIRYQRVPLDSRFVQSARVKDLMRQYQEGLQQLGLDGLGIREMPYPGKELLGGFAGSEKCESCHEQSYRVWKKSGHAKAWQTLKSSDPPRVHDPECIACHVVGWSPQNFRPFESGFKSEKETPHLIDVGCETCHGPGQAHVDAEQGAEVELQEKLQKAATITLKQAQQALSTAISDQQPCMNCHDLDNSPDFNFHTYWPKIEHHEE